ncbi:MAG: four helix bundle protein [Flavobacteriales bacterium]|nr:four helix bundle protein [Flavobacteriales bacterium]
MGYGDFRDLDVYQVAFELSMDIFRMTKSFPKEEMYGLTSQIRRSSRSVCSNFGEGYRKRQYTKHFVSKVSDADMENSETQIWWDYSLECGYISSERHSELMKKSLEVGRRLNHVINNPEVYMTKGQKQQLS